MSTHSLVSSFLQASRSKPKSWGSGCNAYPNLTIRIVLLDYFRPILCLCL